MRESYKKIDNIDDKVKEFGYDSLCLRYNIVRDAQAEWEIYHKRVDPDSAYTMAKRDKMRFYDILNNLIGEHK